jgi:hypothetical protein
MGARWSLAGKKLYLPKEILMKVLLTDEEVTNRNLVPESRVNPELQVVCGFEGARLGSC